MVANPSHFNPSHFPKQTESMASSGKERRVVAHNGNLGCIKGENFYPESNFIISGVICCVKVREEKGWLVRMKRTNQDNER